MDASSIITQVSRDDDHLNTFPALEKPAANGKKPRKNILKTLFCCCFSKSEPTPTGSNGSCGVQDNIVPSYFASRSLSDPTHSDNQYLHLLPPISHRDMHKKCMVIDLDETLVHSSFKPISNADFIVPVEIDGTVHQVYVLKRPYVDEFLQKMGELYECILFTASLAKYADPVANLLDKWNVFRARLFRESCSFHRGNYVKDLGRLGRDLQKVVIMDNSPASYIFHPDNAVPVSSWFDDMTDSELIDLVPFLETLSKVDNVYSVLRNCNNPLSSMPLCQNPELLASNGQTQGPITQLVPTNRDYSVQLHQSAAAQPNNNNSKDQEFQENDISPS